MNTVTALLNDKSKFIKNDGKRDKTPTIGNSVRKRIKTGRDNKFHYVRKNPTIWFQKTTALRPKVHKVEIPLHPVLDVSNSPHHNMTEWQADSIETIGKQIVRFGLRDTFKFVDLSEPMNVFDKRRQPLDVC